MNKPSQISSKLFSKNTKFHKYSTTTPVPIKLLLFITISKHKKLIHELTSPNYWNKMEDHFSCWRFILLNREVLLSSFWSMERTPTFKILSIRVTHLMFIWQNLSIKLTFRDNYRLKSMEVMMMKTHLLKKNWSKIFLIPTIKSQFKSMSRKNLRKKKLKLRKKLNQSQKETRKSWSKKERKKINRAWNQNQILIKLMVTVPS